MKLYMIRHGETKGNREHRYVGSTDEGLLAEAAERLKARKLPDVEKVYVSPMKRCRETAEILYPQHTQIVVEAFRECEFGEFEYRNYGELNGNPDYQRFIDTMGMCGFPGGEDRAAFQERCVNGFQQMLESLSRPCGDIAMVVHGGTIMALLDRYSDPHRDYYEWQIKNGEGYVSEIECTGDFRTWKIQNIKPMKLEWNIGEKKKG